MSKNRTEQLFSKAARFAGLKVEPPQSIRIDSPVENRNGILNKTVTVPDFYVIDPATNNSAHVEVTQGSGNNSHKKAQLRVVEAAGINNYVLLTGNQVREASAQSSARDAKELLIRILGLLLSI